TLTVAAPGVLANDTDPDGDALTAVLATSPAHGALTLNADGSFTYTPSAGFSGSDSFTYQAYDGFLTSNAATATIGVQRGGGDILITASNKIYDYTQSGSLVSILPVPYPSGSTDSQISRDLTVDANQLIHVYNGTFTPYLSSYNPVTKAWVQHTVPGWSTIADISFGGVASFQQYVFVTDMSTYGGGAQGLIRFDTTDFSYQRFATTTDFA